MVSASAVDTPWLAAAAARQVCEFVAVKAPANPFRFDVIPGVAVVAPEEDAISLVVLCVRFVTEGHHDGSVVLVCCSRFRCSRVVPFRFRLGTSVCLDYCASRRVG